MADNVGSMEVTYSVGVEQAIKGLGNLSKKMDQIFNLTEKQTKADKGVIIEEKKHKESLKTLKFAWAAMGAAAIGVLYGLIKASSYATIYTSQFSASIQQLANHFMEETGLNKAIEDFLRQFQVFIDDIERGNSVIQTILGSLKLFTAWFMEQSSLIQFIVILGGLFIAISAIVAILGTLAIASSAITGGLAVLGTIAAYLTAKFIMVTGLISGVVSWFAAGSAAAMVLAGVIGLLIGIISVWLLKKAGILDWFSTLGEKFRDWDSWIHDILVIIVSPIALLGAAIIDIVDGNFGFPMLKSGFETVKTAISSVIDRVKDLINWMKKIPSSIGNFISGGGTSISPGSMPGGGDYNDVVIAPGGNVITTHPKDFLIATKKPEDLMSGRGGGGGNTYNISPIINITSSGSNSDISRQVSKAISDEIKRMTKI